MVVIKEDTEITDNNDNLVEIDSKRVMVTGDFRVERNLFGEIETLFKKDKDSGEYVPAISIDVLEAEGNIKEITQVEEYSKYIISCY